MKMRIHRLPLIYDVGEPFSLERLKVAEGRLCLGYVHEDAAGGLVNIVIEFEEAIAYRYTEHAYVLLEQIERENELVAKSPSQGSGEVLLEMEDSLWLQEMAVAWKQSYGHPKFGGKLDFSYRHYRLCIWDEGCHEIVAKSFKVVKTPTSG